jgi:hypothetical protein
MNLLWVIIIGLWINGCMHSQKKHNNDPTWLQITPAAIYRGIEYYWHDDFKGVDWKLRIENDAETLCSLLELSTEKYSIDETKMQIENFSKKINSYPKDKIDTLNKASKMFIRYYKASTADLLNVLDSILVGNEVGFDNKWDIFSSPIRDSLSKQFNLSFIKSDKQSFDSIVIDFKMKQSFGEIEKLREIKKNVLQSVPFIFNQLENSDKQIFKKEE